MIFDCSGRRRYSWSSDGKVVELDCGRELIFTFGRASSVQLDSHSILFPSPAFLSDVPSKRATVSSDLTASESNPSLAVAVPSSPESNRASKPSNKGATSRWTSGKAEDEVEG